MWRARDTGNRRWRGAEWVGGGGSIDGERDAGSENILSLRGGGARRSGCMAERGIQTVRVVLWRCTERIDHLFHRRRRGARECEVTKVLHRERQRQ